MNLQDIDLALTRVLLERQKSGLGPITYSQCAAILTEKLGRPVHAHGGLRMPLYRVAGLCNDLGLPYLSTLVTLKYQPKRTQVGEGFYKMVCGYHPEYRNMSISDVWQTEYSRLQSCRDWSPLEQFLEKHRA